MSQQAVSRVVVVGGGNVGQALAYRLYDMGVAMQWVVRRTATLPRLLPCMVEQISDMLPDADLYLLAVGDKDIATVAVEVGELVQNRGLAVHTSGATPMPLPTTAHQRYGVLWPLQTFTKGRQPDFSKVPAIYDAATDDDAALLADFAAIYMGATVRLDDTRRAQLHLAAVMVNNFSNHLMLLAGEVAGADTRLLLPLLEETIAKLYEKTPDEAQTGPAIRGDENTIARHLALLAHQPENTRSVYAALTESIKRRRS